MENVSISLFNKVPPYKKLKRESFTVAELEDIAEAVGVTFERNFILDDGDTV